jgi:molybdate transport system permease protein
MNELWSSLRYSFCIAIAATVLATLVALPISYAARKTFRGKSLLEACIIIPLVLPPTVVGYLLLVVFGRTGIVGKAIWDWTGGYTILFRPEGGILAGAIVALPLLYLPSKAAFATVEREMEEIALLFGANRWEIFWFVSLPVAARGVASGLVLAFARALGEFGATVMVMAPSSGHSMTLPVLVYSKWVDGELHKATAPVLLLSAVALLLAWVFNRIPRT